MSSHAEPEAADDGWERPAVFPEFRVPASLAAVVAWGVLAAAVLEIVAALVTAVSYRVTLPAGSQNVVGLVQVPPPPSIGFASRVSLFADRAGDLTVALLVVVAVVMISMTRRSEDAPVFRARWGLLFVAAWVVGAVVAAANLAKAIVILSNATGPFTLGSSPNKAASILALVPPVATAGAVVMYGVARRRWTPDRSGGLTGNDDET